MFKDKKYNYLIKHSIFIYIISYIIKDFILLFGGITNSKVNMIISCLLFIPIIILFIKCLKNDLDNIKYLFKNIYRGLFTIFTYLFLTILKSIIPAIFHIAISDPLMKGIYSTSFELLIIFILILINLENLSKNLKEFKEKYKEYLDKYLKYWILVLFIMMVSNLFISFLNNGGIAGNEEAIRGLIKESPVFTFVSAVLLAPIIEELVFRKSIQNIFSNKYVFIIISGLLFGLMHILGNVNSWVDILYIIPYSAPGIIFAYILQKSDNIFVPIGIHFIHNGVLTTIQIIASLI